MAVSGCDQQVSPTVNCSWCQHILFVCSFIDIFAGYHNYATSLYDCNATSHTDCLCADIARCYHTVSCSCCSIRNCCCFPIAFSYSPHFLDNFACPLSCCNFYGAIAANDNARNAGSDLQRYHLFLHLRNRKYGDIYHDFSHTVVDASFVNYVDYVDINHDSKKSYILTLAFPHHALLLQLTTSSDRQLSMAPH